MNSVTFTDLGNKKILCPGSFNELSAKQLTNIIGWLYATDDESRRKYRMLLELFDFNRTRKATWIFKWHLKPLALVEMFPLTDFVFKESDLTKNLLPVVRPRRKFFWQKSKELYGPEDRLNNISFIEFIKCERFFKKFQKTREVKHLNSLIAVLYRAKKKNYDKEKDLDIRDAYIDDNRLIELNAKNVSKVSLNERLAIMHYYMGSRNSIFNSPAYKSVFVQVDKVVDVKEKRQIKEENSWEKSLINMATSVQEIENIANTRLTTVLYYLNEKIENSKRANQPIKNTTI